ncbi:MAG: hypothetical protein HUU16_14420, partial [Candidatus Omnitrophica bacterium]|nr:hypothetical protein [Candidatus Omnitrophota bacterium]
MPRLFRCLPLTALMVFSLAMRSEADPLRFEVYATSDQVDSLLGSDSKRAEVLHRLREFRISKVYLETVRSGREPDWEELRATRDFLRRNGIRVAGGIATVPGPGFGVGSTGSAYAMNYEAPETRKALSEILEKTAAEFDEIIIDDFLMTDDESELSKSAKGDRSWSEYRLELLTRIARECILAPAKSRNADVRITIKYPQWYDRFHVYGYHVLIGPELFDEVWVGTETRNPDTARFGYTQPTEGFINYSWLASIGEDKVKGGWFDTIECEPDHVFMQAVQSVLAGAKHLTVFNLADIAGDSPLVGRLKANLDFLEHLAALVGDRKPEGLVGYKPPHSDPGIDIYVYDFLCAMGVPIRMAASPPESPAAILLAAQASSDPDIANRIEEWLEGGSVVVFTPGFALASRSPRMAKTLGYSESWDGTYLEVVPEVIAVSGTSEPNDANVPALDLPVMRFDAADRAVTLCVGIQDD